MPQVHLIVSTFSFSGEGSPLLPAAPDVARGRLRQLGRRLRPRHAHRRLQLGRQVNQPVSFDLPVACALYPGRVCKVTLTDQISVTGRPSLL